MTQEQLAEALGVTVGAVYKWENGRSTPEVGLLVEIADLFGVSVDALLDYKVCNNDRAHMVERLKNADYQQLTEDSFLDVEKSIRKYPNHFEIIYYSARLYWTAGMMQNRRNWFERALELLRHTLLLVDQNADENISALSIQVQMAKIYAELDENEKAIELLKANNPMYINHAQIGNRLAISGRLDEAIPYLSKALIYSVVNQLETADGYLNVYMRKKNYGAAMEILQWTLSNIRSLQHPGQSCFLNRVEAVYLTLLAEMNLHMEQKKEAKDILRQAKQVASSFDADPDYSVKRLRFVMHDESTSAYDSLGETALAGIWKILQEEKDPKLTALWEEILHE